MSDEELIAQIARDYYLNGLTLGNVCDKYGLSRYKIAKYLETGLAEGIVQIRIRARFEQDKHHERELCERYGLAHAYVLKHDSSLAAENAVEAATEFAEFAAQQAQMLIDQARIVGMTWGNTLKTVVDQFSYSHRPDKVFIQFLGRDGRYHSRANASSMAQQVASQYDAEYLTLDCPLYIFNDDARRLMAQERSLEQTLDVASHMDAILCGIGTPRSLASVEAWNSQRWQLFPARLEDIAGFAFGRAFNAQGQFLGLEEDKTFGLSIERIMAVPRRVAVIVARFKAAAARAALRGGIVTDLITTEAVANAILTDDDRVG